MVPEQRGAEEMKMARTLQGLIAEVRAYGDKPEDMLDLIAALADECEYAASDCTAAWQDAGAGAPWAAIGKALRRCETSAAKACAKAYPIIGH